MKNRIEALSGIAVLNGLILAFAETNVAGPKGGKLLENEAPRAEFLVKENHLVSITFYDENLKPVPVTSQVVTAIAEAKEGKIKLSFEKKGDISVSTAALPHGDGFNIVAQLKKNETAEPQNFRTAYDSHICGGCKLQEYACTCDE